VTRRAWLIPVLAAIAVYLPALWSGFVWDDLLVLRNQLGALDGLADVFRPPPGIERWSYEYYRPAVVASYLLDQRLYGSNPTGFHATNVACFVVTVVLVGLLVRRLLDGRRYGEQGAIAAATLFAVHPIHVESVSWIAGRPDVMATLGLTASLLLLLRWRDRGQAWVLVLAAACYGFGLLAKETALLTLLLAPLVLLLVAPPAGAAAPLRPALAWAVAAGAYAVPTLLYFGLRAYGGVRAASAGLVAGEEPAWRALRSAAWYVRESIVPWPQSIIVTWDEVPGAGGTLLLLLGALALAGGCLWLWRRRGEPLGLLAVCWFWASLALALWIAARGVTNTPLAVRHLYLPSVALAIAAGALYAHALARSWRVQGTVALGMLVAVCAAGTLERGRAWRNDVALWTDTTRRVTDQALPWFNLAMAHREAGDDAAGREALLRATASTDRNVGIRARAHWFIGQEDLVAGRLDEAERHLRQSIALAPNHHFPHASLGMLQVRRMEQLARAGRAAARDEAAEAAIHHLVAAIAREPRFILARVTLAQCLASHAEWLAAEGDAAFAQRRVEAAREQMDAVEALLSELPAAQREGAVGALEVDSGIDVPALRARIGDAPLSP
jgi:hypothetical protein